MLGEYFPNLSSLQLFVQGQLKEANNTTVAHNEVVSLINNSLHTCSLFSSITVAVRQNLNTIIYNDYTFVSPLHKWLIKCKLLINFLIWPDVINTLGHAARKMMGVGSSNIHLMAHLVQSYHHHWLSNPQHPNMVLSDIVIMLPFLVYTCLLYWQNLAWTMMENHVSYAWFNADMMI